MVKKEMIPREFYLFCSAEKDVSTKLLHEESFLDVSTNAEKKSRKGKEGGLKSPSKYFYQSHILKPSSTVCFTILRYNIDHHNSGFVT